MQVVRDAKYYEGCMMFIRKSVVQQVSPGVTRRWSFDELSGKRHVVNLAGRTLEEIEQELLALPENPETVLHYQWGIETPPSNEFFIQLFEMTPLFVNKISLAGNAIFVFMSFEQLETILQRIPEQVTMLEIGNNSLGDCNAVYRIGNLGTVINKNNIDRIIQVIPDTVRALGLENICNSLKTNKKASYLQKILQSLKPSILAVNLASNELGLFGFLTLRKIMVAVRDSSIIEFGMEHTFLDQMSTTKLELALAPLSDRKPSKEKIRLIDMSGNFDVVRPWLPSYVTPSPEKIMAFFSSFHSKMGCEIIAEPEILDPLNIERRIAFLSGVNYEKKNISHSKKNPLSVFRGFFHNPHPLRESLLVKEILDYGAPTSSEEKADIQFPDDRKCILQ